MTTPSHQVAALLKGLGHDYTPAEWAEGFSVLESEWEDKVTPPPKP